MADLGGVAKKLINWNAYVRAVKAHEQQGLIHATKTASAVRGCMQASVKRGSSISRAAKNCINKRKSRSRSRSAKSKRGSRSRSAKSRRVSRR